MQEERAAAAAAAEELRAEVQREADEAAAAKISEANAKYQDVLAQLKAERQRIASLQAELQAERNHGVTLEVGSRGAGAATCRPARDEGAQHRWCLAGHSLKAPAHPWQQGRRPPAQFASTPVHPTW